LIGQSADIERWSVK